MNKIGILGVGKLGLAFALIFERHGYDVLASSYKEEYVFDLQQKKLSTTEPKVVDLLKSAENIQYTVDNHAVLDHCDFWYVMVATPSNADGSYDVTSVDQVVEDICNHTAELKDKILLIGCTVNPGDCERWQSQVEHLGVHVAYCPTFAAQGSVVYDIENACGLTIGTENLDVYNRCKQVFLDITDTTEDLIFQTHPRTAEILKLAGNCYATMQISFFNMIGQMILHEGLDNDIEKYSQILNNVKRDTNWRFGFGYGGPCYPRDNRAMVQYAESLGQQYPLGTLVDNFNNNHATWLTDWLLKNNTDHLPFYFKYISYKPGVDIFVESHQLKVCQALLACGATVLIEDTDYINDSIKEMLIKKFGDKIRFVNNTEEQVYPVDL